VSTQVTKTNSDRQASDWYRVKNVDEIDSPALLVYPDRVRENTRRMLEIAGGPDRLRPHVKTHKMSAVIRLQMAAGVTRFKCATPAEAEMVASCGAADILIAHQPVGPKIQRLARLALAYPSTRFSTIADNSSVLRAISAAMTAAGPSVEVLLDIDSGMGRCGIAPGPEAVDLYQLLSKLPNIRPGGLHVYDGHIRESDLAERTATCEAAFKPVDAFRQELLRRGLSVPRVVAGGTPTFPIHAKHPDREASPGTCVFWDAGYGSRFADMNFLPAAIVLSRVISKPGPDRLCLDLGYKAVAADAPDPRVVWVDLPDAKTAVHSEEHLAVTTARANEVEVGAPLYGIPTHICPTCSLYSEAVVVEDGYACDRWKIEARERILTI
jgi:D-serine deaminase-like pyridoxal phosphate-dependent protein